MLARRAFLLVVSSAACGALDLDKGWAETYPSRPITMVVPVAAGSGMDTVARIVAERLRTLGQPIIVENVSGASGSIGIGRVARASPDGYTLSYGAWATHVISGAVSAPPYDLRSDFEPIAQTVNTRFVIAVRKSLPVSDLKDFIAWLKTNPEKASAATSGLGSPAHIGGVLLQNLTGSRLLFVPYRGSAPAMQDLVTGHVDMMIDNAVNALPLHRAGRIKVLAALAGTRLSVAADIPSADEAGVPGFHLDSWHAIWAPKRTPDAIIAKLGASIAEALADPTVQKRVADLGAEIAPLERQTPDGFGAFYKAEIEKWWPIIKAAGIKRE
jgi:tripartite-type tricarboxylate transporter receptor subunit TctC